MRRKLIIWDIDGCFVKSAKFSDDEIKSAKCIKKQPKNKSFCKFAKDFAEFNKNYVITGRKRSLLHNNTVKLLSNILGIWHIDYYPENETYGDLDYYIKWKVDNMIKIINDNLNDFNEFFLFDDNKEICELFAKEIEKYDYINQKKYVYMIHVIPKRRKHKIFFIGDY